MPTSNIPAIGINLDNDSIDFAVIIGCNIIMRGDPMLTADYSTPNEVIAEIGRRVQELITIFPTVRALGMGLSGFADHDAGTVHSLRGTPGWHDIPIRRILTEISGLPCSIDNNAHCFAYAEWQLGAARGMDNVVCINLGKGVGAGIIANGQMLRGHFGAAGEVGQSSIDYDGRIGHYSNRGAFENYAGADTFARDARMVYAAAGVNISYKDCSPTALQVAAEGGCPIARKLLEELGRKIASCMLNCCYILNPEAFIISGYLSGGSEIPMQAIKHHLRSQLFSTHYDMLTIRYAELGDDAALIGAARMGLEKLDYLAAEGL